MFRDTQEELDRLTEELLEEEELPEADDDILNDEIIRSLLEDAEIGEEEAPTDGTADRTNTAQEEKDPVVSFLTVLALLLMTGILGVLVWWLIQIRSFF